MSVVSMANSLTSGTFAGFLVILPLQLWPWFSATWFAGCLWFSGTYLFTSVGMMVDGVRSTITDIHEDLGYFQQTVETLVDEDIFVGLEDFCRIAPSIPIIVNVIISENLFKGKNVQEYKGPCEADGIVDYLKKQSGLASIEIKFANEATVFVGENKVAIVGVFLEISLTTFLR
ncbi:hypothetical protein JHK82_056033 [Glycine max]|nr:hypothetical protein JHK82_056033 [Glycine max]